MGSILYYTIHIVFKSLLWFWLYRGFSSVSFVPIVILLMLSVFETYILFTEYVYTYTQTQAPSVSV